MTGWPSKRGPCNSREEALAQDAEYRLREAIQLEGNFTTEDDAADTMTDNPEKWLGLLAAVCATRTALAKANEKAARDELAATKAR